MIDPVEDYYTIQEAAQLLHVSETTIWRWVAAQRLPAYRVGPRRIRIKKKDLETVVGPVGEAPESPGQTRPDFRAGYDPERARRAILAGAGALAGVNLEELRRDLKAARAQRSRGRRW